MITLDGTDWESLGEVISTDHRITTVDSTAQGLVATAIRREDGAVHTHYRLA